MLEQYPAHATMPATDFERAKRFYGETLGFQSEGEQPGGVFYRSGNTRFLVFPSNGTASGSHTQLGWAVDDIDATVAELKGRGVQFEEYDYPNFKTVNSIFTAAGTLKSAWFKDSEGNLLGIVQFMG
jgi:catechol 2,3-dioxygenase-like lactoylglutathione lyase family enzyme